MKKTNGFDDFVQHLVRSNIDLELIINTKIRERIRASREITSGDRPAITHILDNDEDDNGNKERDDDDDDSDNDYNDNDDDDDDEDGGDNSGSQNQRSKTGDNQETNMNRNQQIDNNTSLHEKRNVHDENVTLRDKASVDLNTIPKIPYIDEYRAYENMKSRKNYTMKPPRKNSRFRPYRTLSPILGDERNDEESTIKPLTTTITEIPVNENQELRNVPEHKKSGIKRKIGMNTSETKIPPIKRTKSNWITLSNKNPKHRKNTLIKPKSSKKGNKLILKTNQETGNWEILKP